jgi:hypothetical protein
VNNKRDYGRVPTIKHVSCIVHEEDKPDQQLEVQVKDLSPGGILFESKEEFAVGTVLSLEIRLPAATFDEPGNVHGRVVHSRKNERTKRFETGIAYIRPK